MVAHGLLKLVIVMQQAELKRAILVTHHGKP